MLDPSRILQRIMHVPIAVHIRDTLHHNQCWDIHTDFTSFFSCTQKERPKNLGLLLAFSILLWYSSTKEGHRPQSGQPTWLAISLPGIRRRYKVGLFIFACYPYRYRQAMQWEKYQPKTTGSILRMYSYAPPPSFIFPTMGLCRMAQRRIPLSESSGGYHLVTRCPVPRIA